MIFPIWAPKRVWAAMAGMRGIATAPVTGDPSRAIGIGRWARKMSLERQKL